MHGMPGAVHRNVQGQCNRFTCRRMANETFAAVLLAPLGVPFTCCRLVCISTPNSSVTAKLYACDGMQVHARAGRAPHHAGQPPVGLRSGPWRLWQRWWGRGRPSQPSGNVRRQSACAGRGAGRRGGCRAAGLGQQHPQPRFRVRYRAWPTISDTKPTSPLFPCFAEFARTHPAGVPHPVCLDLHTAHCCTRAWPQGGSETGRAQSLRDACCAGVCRCGAAGGCLPPGAAALRTRRQRPRGGGRSVVAGARACELKLVMSAASEMGVSGLAKC
jgi:hypothetical protein